MIGYISLVYTKCGFVKFMDTSPFLTYLYLSFLRSFIPPDGNHLYTHIFPEPPEYSTAHT